MTEAVEGYGVLGRGGCWFSAGYFWLLIVVGWIWTGKATVHCAFKNESLEPEEDGMTVLPGVSSAVEGRTLENLGWGILKNTIWHVTWTDAMVRNCDTDRYTVDGHDFPVLRTSIIF